MNLNQDFVIPERWKLYTLNKFQALNTILGLEYPSSSVPGGRHTDIRPNVSQVWYRLFDSNGQMHRVGVTT